MLYESQYPKLPHTWCYPTCPRQATHLDSDCDCGGAKKEWEHWKKLSEQQED